MRRILYAAITLLAVDAAWALAGAGCASDLTATTLGHDQCDAAGQCLAGYSCDRKSNSCVLAGSTSPASSSAATTGSAGSGTVGTGGSTGHGASGGAAGASSTGGSGTTASTGGASSSTTSSTSSTASSMSGTGGSDGGCGDTMTSPDDCGTCGNVCPPPLQGSGTATCSGGVCGVTCGGGLNKCAVTGGHVCVDGSSDPQYCGACESCPGGKTCQGGQCSASSVCGPHLSLCGLTCTDVQSDPANCGTCGNTCSGLTGLCSAGSCVAIACGSGLKGCGNACANEASDPTHCGGCSPCASTQICSASACYPYVFAAGSWECGLNAGGLTQFCSKYGICVGKSVACPP